MSDLPREAKTSKDKSLNTQISYMYRDGSNYKQHATHVFAGPPTPSLVRRLLAAMPRHSDSLASFVAVQVDLMNLQEEMPGEYDDDNGWHELTGIEPVDHAVDDQQTFEQFVTECEAVAEWDDEPRIPHGEPVHVRNDGAHPARATHWADNGDGSWDAVTEDGINERPNQSIKQVPKSGALHYSAKAICSGAFHEVTIGTPGEVTLTAEQVRVATGRVLDEAQLAKVVGAALAGWGLLAEIVGDAIAYRTNSGEGSDEEDEATADRFKALADKLDLKILY